MLQNFKSKAKCQVVGTFIFFNPNDGSILAIYNIFMALLVQKYKNTLDRLKVNDPSIKHAA